MPGRLDVLSYAPWLEMLTARVSSSLPPPPLSPEPRHAVDRLCDARARKKVPLVSSRQPPRPPGLAPWQAIYRPPNSIASARFGASAASNTGRPLPKTEFSRPSMVTAVRPVPLASSPSALASLCPPPRPPPFSARRLLQCAPYARGGRVGPRGSRLDPCAAGIDSVCQGIHDGCYTRPPSVDSDGRTSPTGHNASLSSAAPSSQPSPLCLLPLRVLLPPPIADDGLPSARLQTRPRGFPNLTMPAASSDRAQYSLAAAFPSSRLFANQDIWTSTLSAAREKSIGAQASDEDLPRHQALRSRPARSDDSAAGGSSALNANSEADWPRPWNTDHLGRSVITSPSRPHDGGLAAAAAAATGYIDQQHQQHTAAVGSRAFTNQPYHDDSNVFASAFSARGRTAQDLLAYPVDTMAGYGHHRDASLPPSRHSQISPAYQDLYRASHTPSSSVSQPGHGASYPSQSQSLNQRAFNLNNRIDDELSVQLTRRMALDSPAASFNPPSQPFQVSPGTVPWNSGSNALRYGGVSVELSGDGFAVQYAAVGRSPVERAPSGSGYHLDSGSNGRSYADPWHARPAPRDPRQADVDRRAAAAQPFASAYGGSFFATHYPYAGFSPGFVDLNQNFRQHAVMPPFGLPGLPSAFSPAAGLASPARRDQDPGRGVRSALLEEFRMTHRSNRRWELKDIFNHVVEFSGDQHGSRFIQQKLETANSEEKEQVFREIEPNAIQLMKDVFGNYVVQKFYEHGNQVQKKVLSDKMRGRALDLSVQVYGCRVVQKALEHALVEQQADLTKELEPDILRVIKDQNGNHVVQKMIELVPRKYLDFVMSAMRGQVTGLASHTYGCRVVQRILEHGTAADKLEMMAELHVSAQILLTDQYGNYVAQHVIEHGKAEDRQRMIELVMSQLVALSKHKFASNVVEKCIQFGTAENKTTIRNLLTGGDGTSTLQQLMRDQYGNYVIQKLLDVLEGPDREALVEDIKAQFALKKSGATKQLQALEKLLGEGSKEALSAASVKNGSSANGTPPPLTNESSSPASTRTSTVGLPASQSQDATTAGKMDGGETQVLA